MTQYLGITHYIPRYRNLEGKSKRKHRRNICPKCEKTIESGEKVAEVGHSGDTHHYYCLECYSLLKGYL